MDRAGPPWITSFSRTQPASHELPQDGNRERQRRISKMFSRCAAQKKAEDRSRTAQIRHVETSAASATLIVMIAVFEGIARGLSAVAETGRVTSAIVVLTFVRP